MTTILGIIINLYLFARTSAPLDINHIFISDQLDPSPVYLSGGDDDDDNGDDDDDNGDDDDDNGDDDDDNGDDDDDNGDDDDDNNGDDDDDLDPTSDMNFSIRGTNQYYSK